MNKYRYVERQILCDYDLGEELFNKLDLQVNDIIPLRKVFLLITDKGKKILKRCETSLSDIEFIDEALNYIYLNDKNIIRYCRNRQGDIITLRNGKKYIVLDLIEGREATFTNPVEIMWCSESIAKLHEASKGIEDHLKKSNIKCIYGKNLIDEYTKDIDYLDGLVKLVNKYKYKNEFDTLFLKHIDKVKNEMIIAIDLLKKSSYENMKKNNNFYYLCHNDLAHHNFIIDNDEVNIIDFDYCNIDLRIKDIYIFINKVIKNLGYEKSYIDKILSNYESIGQEITNDEKEILKALISYPDDFVRSVKAYYFKEKAWDQEVFINRFKNKIENDSFRDELLKCI